MIVAYSEFGCLLKPIAVRWAVESRATRREHPRHKFGATPFLDCHDLRMPEENASARAAQGVLHSTRIQAKGGWKHMPTNVSLILKSLAFATLLAQTAAAQKAAVPPVTPPRGPFTCTELIGLYSSGEWWDGGFYDGLGDLKTRWQGRFSHYGYTYEYAKPDSYAWSPANVGGVNNVRLTVPCAQDGDAPDRIVYRHGPGS